MQFMTPEPSQATEERFQKIELGIDHTTQRWKRCGLQVWGFLLHAHGYFFLFSEAEWHKWNDRHQRRINLHWLFLLLTDCRQLKSLLLFWWHLRFWVILILLIISESFWWSFILFLNSSENIPICQLIVLWLFWWYVFAMWWTIWRDGNFCI